VFRAELTYVSWLAPHEFQDCHRPAWFIHYQLCCCCPSTRLPWCVNSVHLSCYRRQIRQPSIITCMLRRSNCSCSVVAWRLDICSCNLLGTSASSLIVFGICLVPYFLILFEVVVSEWWFVALIFGSGSTLTQLSLWSLYLFSVMLTDSFQMISYPRRFVDQCPFYVLCQLSSHLVSFLALGSRWSSWSLIDCTYGLVAFALLLRGSLW